MSARTQNGVSFDRGLPSSLTQWPWWLPVAVLSLIITLIFIDPFIGDWDAFEYTLSAIRGAPSSMALGRMLFIFYNHGLYLIAHSVFGLKPEHAYLVFKYAVIAQGTLAIVACWVLTHDLTRSAHAATLAALLLALSPAFIVYSGQVMTDVPALLITTLALIVHARGLRRENPWMIMIGAALLGAGVNLRESVGFYAPWLVLAPFVCGWRINRRTILMITASCMIFLVCATSVFIVWFTLDANYRASWYGWRESMRIESSRHPVSIRIISPWLTFFFATAPMVFIALPFALRNEWRRQKFSLLLLLAAVGMLTDLLLLGNYSTAVIWRYFLTGLPALLPLTANYLFESGARIFGNARRGLIAIAAAIGLCTVAFGAYAWPLRARIASVRTAAKQYQDQLITLPGDAILIAGAQTIAVKYWSAVDSGEWDVIAPGAGWPRGHLAAEVQARLNAARPVFVDTNPLWWQPCGWHVPEIEELAQLQFNFRFRRVAKTIYEIRLPQDLSAAENPQLTQLLPENRPREVRDCFDF